MQPDMSLATNLTAIFGTFQDVDDFLQILSGCFLCSSIETTNSVSLENVFFRSGTETPCIVYRRQCDPADDVIPPTTKPHWRRDQMASAKPWW